MLYQLQQLLAASSGVRTQDADDFNRLLWAAHLSSAASQAAKAGLLELAARQLTALLRFVGIVPADRWVEAAWLLGVLGSLRSASRPTPTALAAHNHVHACPERRAFYEAGAAWRAAGRPSMAFVMLNRYLDLADAQEDPAGTHSLAQLENTDFAATGELGAWARLGGSQLSCPRSFTGPAKPDTQCLGLTPSPAHAGWHTHVTARPCVCLSPLQTCRLMWPSPSSRTPLTTRVRR
jgi:hypothetical protein